MNEQSPIRRKHSAELKARVLSECQKPGASIAAVALAHGLNANLVRKWLVGRGLGRPNLESAELERASSVMRGAVNGEPVAGRVPQGPFVGLQMPNAGPQAIQIELSRGERRLKVNWPAAQAESCAAWLRELAAGVTK
jgi:transposase